MPDGNDSAEYEVVVNHEAQYSIWSADQPVPPGWRTVGQRGPRQHCLDWIDENWTDMRPLSLRNALRDAERP